LEFEYSAKRMQGCVVRATSRAANFEIRVRLALNFDA